MAEVPIEGAECNDRHPCVSGYHCITGECYPPFTDTGCTNDKDCEGSGKPWCLNLSFVNRCVVCLVDSHCSASQYCHYSTLCDDRCSTHDQCGGGPDFCDTFSQRCVQCLDDGDCHDGNMCNVEIGKCIAEISTKDGTNAKGRL
ncbi:MAG TPA: hypothetical protein EYN06_04415 [Myxococcales bacterium]|nr:hypothetical protein [Myxococcales bacterium]HIN85704.1 hypothetical protein [Myxococcales bacterium]